MENSLIPQDFQTESLEFTSMLSKFDKSSNFSITTIAQANHFAGLNGKAKQLEKKIVEFFKPLKQKAQESHRALCRAENKALEPLFEFYGAVDYNLAVFHEAAEARAAQEAIKRTEMARKEAEDRKLGEALELEQRGLKSDSEAILNETTQVQAVPVPKVEISGTHFRVEWYGEVKERGHFLELVKHVAAHPEFLGLLEPNEQGLKAFARSTQGLTGIPGVTFYSKKIPVTRTK